MLGKNLLKLVMTNDENQLLRSIIAKIKKQKSQKLYVMGIFWQQIWSQQVVFCVENLETYKKETKEFNFVDQCYYCGSKL